MRLQQLHPDDDEGIAAWLAVEHAVARADAPWMHPRHPLAVRTSIAHGWDGEPGEHYLATSAAGTIGLLAIHTSDYDNRELAWLHLAIAPEYRHQGHGRALLEAALGRCADLGRPLLGIDGWDSPATVGFAAATGFEQRAIEVNRRQHLAEIPPGALEQWYADAAAAAGDYEVLRLAGSSPDELLPALAELTASINDAPTDDLEFEDEVYTADRVRAYEAAQQAGGAGRLYRTVARHRGTGALAGHSVVVVDTVEPRIGHQHDTTVHRQHRGHRLGQLVKADLLRWLIEAEPTLSTIDTWNAESNSHMIEVNERLGYRVLGRQLVFQRRRDRN